MNKCLNCGAEIKQKEGARERKFCDNQNACKQAYHNKNKKQPRFVRIETYNQLEKTLAEMKEKLQTKPPPIKQIASNDGVIPAVENQKPTMQKGESGVDFLIRLNEWKKNNK